MRDGDGFVRLLLQRLFNLLETRAGSDGCLELCRLSPVDREALSERVRKVSYNPSNISLTILM